MKARTLIYVVLVAMIVLAIPFAAAGGKVGTNSNNNGDKQGNDNFKKPVTGETVEALKALVPATLEDAQAKIGTPLGNYIMWTNDGVHIMWGTYGFVLKDGANPSCGKSMCDPSKAYCLEKCSADGYGYFIGKDDQGKTAWGVFGKRLFVGVYDDKPFDGKWNDNKWTANGLFGLDKATGGFVTFKTAPTMFEKPLPPGTPVIQ